MAGNKRDVLVLSVLGAFILGVSVFWSYKAESPFLYAKELFAKAGVLILLGAVLWRYNKFFSLFIFYAFVASFAKLTSRNLWALGNLRDFFLYYLLLRIILERTKPETILKFFFYAFLIQLSVTWCQYFGFDPSMRNYPLLDYSHYHKIAGTFGNTHIVATWLALCAPFALLFKNKVFKPSVVLFTIISLHFFRPATYGGIAALFAIIATIDIIRNPRSRRIIGYAVFFVAAMIAGKQSILIRLENFKHVLTAILQHPILGYGLNSFGGLRIPSILGGDGLAQAHNEFAQLYCEIGIAALLVIPFILRYIKNLKRIAATTTGLIVISQFMGFLFVSLYGFPLHIAPMAILFLTNIAVCDTILANAS